MLGAFQNYIAKLHSQKAQWKTDEVMHKNEVQVLEEEVNNYKYECSKLNSNLEHHKRRNQELNDELTAFHIK